MMKRLMLLIAVAALVAALPLSRFLMAAPPQGKVTMCHMSGDDFPCEGHYIRVAQTAVQKHLDHGDFIEEGVVGEPCGCESE